MSLAAWLACGAMGPLSLDLRVRIVEAYEGGEGSVREIAERFMVTPKTVQKYRELWKRTGSVRPRPRGGGWSRKIDDALLRQILEESPNGTLDPRAVEYAPAPRRRARGALDDESSGAAAALDKKEKDLPSQRAGPTGRAARAPGRRRLRMGRGGT